MPRCDRTPRLNKLKVKFKKKLKVKFKKKLKVKLWKVFRNLLNICSKTLQKCNMSHKKILTIRFLNLVLNFTIWLFIYTYIYTWFTVDCQNDLFSDKRLTRIFIPCVELYDSMCYWDTITKKHTPIPVIVHYRLKLFHQIFVISALFHSYCIQRNLWCKWLIGLVDPWRYLYKGRFCVHLSLKFLQV